MRDLRLASRYVLYDDRTFVLQYEDELEYRGTYVERDGRIDFAWEAWSLAGPWGATGALTEDSLTVKYNLIMQLTDFEDWEYRRVR